MCTPERRNCGWCERTSGATGTETTMGGNSSTGTAGESGGNFIIGSGSTADGGSGKASGTSRPRRKADPTVVFVRPSNRRRHGSPATSGKSCCLFLNCFGVLAWAVVIEGDQDPGRRE